MNVSVVICAYTLDRWNDLTAAVRSCAVQTRPPDEIIVVIDYNDELLLRTNLELADVVMVVDNRLSKGLSGARNTGVISAAGDVIVFLDDDAFADSQWLAELMKPFEDPLVAGVGGWALPNWPERAPVWFPETFYWVFGCSYSGLPENLATIRNPIGANMAMRRHVFDAVGGFTSGLGRIGRKPLGCEETELCIRYSASFPGERFVLNRDAVVHHRVPASRLTWHYFWTRCWAEGISKAAVSSLVGAERGLASERQHAMRSLPKEILSSLRSVRHSPLRSSVRIGLIVAGSLIAAAGLFRGRIALKKAPMKSFGTDLEQLRRNLRHERDSKGEPDSPSDARLLREAEKGFEPNPSSDDPSPVHLVQLAIDEQPYEMNEVAQPGDRLWIEVLSHGSVVGVVEKRAERGGISTAVLEELAETFIATSAGLDEPLVDSLLPRATVVIPTIYKRREDLMVTVWSLLAQDYPDFEVIIVDNRSAAHPRNPIELPFDARVRVEYETTPGISAARNRGVTLASGEFVAFTDDDVFVDEKWLRRIGERFSNDPMLDAVGGMVRPRELDTRPQLWFEEFFGGFTKSFESNVWSLKSVGDADPLFPYSPGRFAAGCNMAIRRTNFEKNGGFDVRLGTGTPAKGGEDLAKFIDIILAGGKVAFEPTALVRHSHRRTEAEFKVQVFGYGAGLTAMYTALIVKDPSQIWSIARRVPLGLRILLRPESERSPSLAPSYPRSTRARHLLGMAYGPLAYARSARRTRRSARESQNA